MGHHSGYFALGWLNEQHTEQIGAMRQDCFPQNIRKLLTFIPAQIMKHWSNQSYTLIYKSFCPQNTKRSGNFCWQRSMGDPLTALSQKWDLSARWLLPPRAFCRFRSARTWMFCSLPYRLECSGASLQGRYSACER